MHRLRGGQTASEEVSSPQTSNIKNSKIHHCLHLHVRVTEQPIVILSLSLAHQLLQCLPIRLFIHEQHTSDSGDAQKQFNPAWVWICEQDTGHQPSRSLCCARPVGADFAGVWGTKSLPKLPEVCLLLRRSAIAALRRANSFDATVFVYVCIRV